jgi:hypothetical protein
VNAFALPSGQQTHGRFRLFLHFRLDRHLRPTLHRRGRSTSPPAADDRTGVTYTAPASAAALLSSTSLLIRSCSVILPSYSVGCSPPPEPRAMLGPAKAPEHGTPQMPSGQHVSRQQWPGGHPSPVALSHGGQPEQPPQSQ